MENPPLLQDFAVAGLFLLLQRRPLLHICVLFVVGFLIILFFFLGVDSHKAILADVK